MVRFAMRKVKSIDDIARECDEEGVRYAVSVDAPLVTALNARLPRNLFGFAFTPVQIADSCASDKIRAAPDTDLQVCRKIMHIVPGATLRFTHSTVKKIREIRRYTNEVQGYLSKREKEIYEAYLQTQPLDNVMDSITDADLERFYMDRRTAVIDVDFFSSQDKMMIPHSNESYVDNTDPDTGEDFVIDRIYSIGNDRQIAECVADLITHDNCNDVAIVLDSGGSIAEAVRSALYRRNIPFKNNMAVKDLAAIRDFLRLLSVSIKYKTVRVGDVRELFSSYGARGNCLTLRADRYLLCRFTRDYLKRPDEEEDSTTVRLRDIMERIGEGDVTFDDVVSMLPGKDGKSSVKILLRDMNLGDRTVDEAAVTDLEYAVNNIDDLKHNEQIPEDERRGVLLADCRNSVYIDRSLVFFIGLDEAWHNTPSGKDYIRDPQGFEEKEAMRLRILLQQGDRRVYVIRPSTGGKATTPCPTFETIADIEGRPCHISGFKDMCNEVVSGSWHVDVSASPLPSVESDRDVVASEKLVFDKTSYNNWRDCPYRFAMKRLLSKDSEDDKKALFGSFVHEFAEFSFCFPELAREGFDRYVDVLFNRYAGISNTCMGELDAYRFRTIMRHVMSYTASVRPSDLVLDGDNTDRKHPNFLIADEPRTGNRYSTLAETRIESAEGHRFYAVPDLVIGSDIIDYKTGAAKNVKDIANAFNKPNELAEFQPLIYTKVVQERLGNDQTVRFNLVYFGNHVAETVSESVDGDPDMSKSIRVVEITPLSDVEFMDRYAVMDRVYEEVRDMSSYSNFVSKWDQICRTARAIASEPGWVASDRTLELMLGNTGIRDRKKMTSFLNRIYKFMGDVRAIDDRKVVVTRQYIERFARTVDEEAVKAEQYLELPVFAAVDREKVNCDYCEFKNTCMSTMAEDYERGEE